MKTDYNKKDGHVVNLDQANEYAVALHRRQRNLNISKLIDMLPELMYIVDNIDKIRDIIDNDKL